MDTAGPASSRRSGALWVMRLVWAAQALLGSAAIGQALEGRSRPVQLVGTAGSWAIWFGALLATLLPGALSLTALRMVLAGWVGTAVLTGLTGASPAAVAVAVGGATVAAVVGYSGEVGQAFVQGSAYGDERRLPLRPPGPLLLGPIPILGAATLAATLAGPLLLAAAAWWSGAVVTATAGVLLVFVGRRFHVLSCRWLVFVPAGLVVHDSFVLAETAMFRRAEVDGLGLADAATEAADLTGAALGPAVEVRLAGIATMVLAPRRGKPGPALHVRSFIVSPTRPGRALAEARRRGFAG